MVMVKRIRSCSVHMEVIFLPGAQAAANSRVPFISSGLILSAIRFGLDNTGEAIGNMQIQFKACLTVGISLPEASGWAGRIGISMP